MTWQLKGNIRGPQGSQGPQGEPGQDGTSVQLKGSVNTVGELPTGATAGDLYVVLVDGNGYVWNGSAWANVGPIRGPAGADGVDGREIQLQKSATHVQWRYVGDATWVNLILLSEITGPQGSPGATGATGSPGADGVDGKEIELQKSATHVQWRYVGGTTWTNLVVLSEITGPQGIQGPPGTTTWGGITDKPTTFPPSAHGHVIADVTGLQAALDAKAGTAVATTSTAGLMSSTDKTKLDGVAAGATANATDAQLRDRSTHTGTQAISTVTGLQTALDGKAASSHGHVIADVTGLQSALDAKAPTASPSFTGRATVQAVRETGVTANTGTAYTVDITARTVLDLTLTGNCAFTFPTPTAYDQFTLLLRQDATGNRTVTWPASVRWPGGTAPTITGTAGRTDVISFVSDGTYWLGFVGGQNFNRA